MCILNAQSTYGASSIKNNAKNITHRLLIIWLWNMLCLELGLLLTKEYLHWHEGGYVWELAKAGFEPTALFFKGYFHLGISDVVAWSTWASLDIFRVQTVTSVIGFG